MQKVQVENNADGTTLITINRPERRNAICAETALLLQKAFQDFERSGTQKAAVVTGAGNEAFSAGADTGNFPAQRALHEVKESEDADEARSAVKEKRKAVCEGRQSFRATRQLSRNAPRVIC
jgi:enoyl-CoA hydratase/carnithine racemase